MATKESGLSPQECHEGLAANNSHNGLDPADRFSQSLWRLAKAPCAGGERASIRGLDLGDPAQSLLQLGAMEPPDTYIQDQYPPD